jgi:hypothetical protein
MVKHLMLYVALVLSMLAIIVSSSHQCEADGWEQMESNTSEPLVSIYGFSENDVYAVGHGIWWGSSNSTTSDGVFMHYDGTKWEKVTHEAIDTLTAVWGSSPDNVFAVGSNGTIIYYNGSGIEKIESGRTEWLSGIWGFSPTDIFVTGYYFLGIDGNICLHWAGEKWRDISAGIPESSRLNGIWGNSSTNIFCVGDWGTILNYNGTQWNTMESGTRFDLYDIWGTSEENVFAVGNMFTRDMYSTSGIILHYNGSAWEKMDIGSTEALFGIWGSSAENVYAVGYDGILHFNGSNWNRMACGDQEYLLDIWGASSLDVFAVGHSGTILHYNGSAEPTATPTPTSTPDKGLSSGALAGIGVGILFIVSLSALFLLKRKSP